MISNTLKNIMKYQRIYNKSLVKFSQGACLTDVVKGEAKEGRAIYLDLQATTLLDFRVLDKMMPYLTIDHGNPHSRTHEYGWVTEQAVEDSRKKLAQLIKANEKEIYFTSGATESNNMALKGLAKYYGQLGKKHFITLQTEHKCVLDTCRYLQEEGYDVTYLPVQTNGLVDLDVFQSSIRKDTIAASIMFVNNEIGVIQPLKQLGDICKQHGIFLHTDAAQALGKVPIDVNDMNIDLMSMSSHKVYGPKGIGALYVRRRPKVRIIPLMNGGGQERGLRSGTLAPALVVGFGEACSIAQREMESDLQHITKLFQRLLKGVQERIPYIQINGDLEQRSVCNLNISFAYVEGESLLMALKNVAVSSGSACTSASLEPSYVLRALGVDDEMAHTSIRFGIGRFTTEQEIDFTIDLLVKHVERLREISPLYEMVQEGIDLKSIQWSQPH